MAHDPGVPLQAYLDDHPEVTALFICRDCARWFEIPLRTVALDLERRGLGGGATGIRDVGRFARKPCAGCGGRRFETRPGWQGRPERKGRGPDAEAATPGEGAGRP